MRFQRSIFAGVLLAGVLRAAGQSPTVTTLAVLSGGVPATAVKEETAVTLSATVFAGNAPVSPGLVSFCDAAPPHCTDVHLLGTAGLGANGTAVWKFYPAAGTHTYTAVFAGTHTAGPSLASAGLTVSPFYPSSTVITYPAAVAPGTYTFSVSVTGSGALEAPTGTVSILDTSDGNAVLGMAALTPGANATGSGGGSTSTFSVPVATTLQQTGVPGTQQVVGYAAVADFNGDGKPDVAVVYDGLCPTEPIPPPPPPDSMVNVLLGNGDGTLTQSFSYVLGAGCHLTPLSIAVGDFNSDGKLDMVVASAASAPEVASLTLFLGKGDGTFSAGTALPAAQSPSPQVVVSGDFNGDGIPDLMAANGNNSLYVLLGRGDGTFALQPLVATGVNPVSLALGDFNGDGVADVAVVNAGGNTVQVFLGKGDGTFALAPALPGSISVNPMASAAADFNGDGIVDLGIVYAGAATPSGHGTVQVLLGKGDGTFTEVEEYSARSNLNSIAVGDFNGNGLADLAVSDLNGLVWVLPNAGGGQFGGPTVPKTEGAPVALTVGDFNGDGVADLLASCNDSGYVGAFMNALLSQSGGRYSATVSTTTVSDFFVVGAGMHPLVASYAGDGNYAPSVSAAEGVGAAQAATTLQVGATPGTINYGQSVTLTATVSPESVDGVNATGTVTFTVGSTVIGNSPLANGAATFQTSALPAGVDAVTATYAGDANYLGSTGSVRVTVNGSSSATMLAVAPDPALVGQPVTLTSEVVGVSSATTPSGVVTFYNGATAVGQATLDATGSASYTLGGLAGGSYVLTAVYAGSGGLVGSTSPGVTLVVSRYASTTTLTATPNPAGAGQPTTLTAAVSGAAGIATGVVTFYDGGTALGMATLDAGGHAEFSTSTLALGTHDLTAAYAGSAAYGASVSGVVDEVVQTPGFTIALASPSLTLQTYLHTTTGVTLASAGDFSDSLTLACTNAPKYVTCEFAPSPAGLTANGSATVAFYLDTDSIVGGDARQGIWAAILVPLGWMALVRRRRRVAGLMLVVLAVGGCGGSVITKVPSTAPGTYAVNVTATGASSGLQRTAVLMLTVTP